MMAETQREKLKSDPVEYWKNSIRLWKARRKLTMNDVLFKIKLRSEDGYKACVKETCGELINDIWPKLGIARDDMELIKAIYEKLD